MKTTIKILFWLPRILGILLFLFVGMFALDAFDPKISLLHQVLGFLIHLIPAFLVLVVVIIAWKWEYIGGPILILMALLYALKALNHPDWILFISVPVAFVGGLFILGKFLRKQQFRDKNIGTNRK